MTNYKVLCAELHAAFNTYAVDMAHHDLLDRARAALAAKAEGEELRLDGGYESGSMWTGHPLRPAALAVEPEPPDAREVEKLREAPAAWLYRGDPDFDGTTWRVNWHVTMDERVARFKARPIKPIPLFRHPVALAEPKPPVDGESD